jgi:hypothetical protein
MAYDNEDINKRQRKAKAEERKEEAIKVQHLGQKQQRYLDMRQVIKRLKTQTNNPT